MAEGDSNNIVQVVEGMASVRILSAKEDDSHATFTEQFRAFSKFGDSKSDGRTITLSQSDKWMKQAKVIDGRTITSTDTGIHFKKMKSIKATLTDYNKFLDDLATSKKVDVKSIKRKLTECGTPLHSGSSTQKANISQTVQRLTDTSKYTGTQKQRFDDSGKGKGSSG